MTILKNNNIYYLTSTEQPLLRIRRGEDNAEDDFYKVEDRLFNKEMLTVEEWCFTNGYVVTYYSQVRKWYVRLWLWVRRKLGMYETYIRIIKN